MLGFLIFKQSTQTMATQYENAMLKQMSIYFANLENEIHTINKQQQSLVYDDDVAYLSSKRIDNIDFNMSRSINRIIAKLNYIANTNENITNVQLDMISLGRSLTASKSTLCYNELDKITDGNILKDSVFAHQFYYYKNQLYCINTSNYYSDNIDKQGFIIKTSISKETLLHNISLYNIDKFSSSAIYFEDFDLLLSESDIISNSYSDIKKIMKSNESDSFYITLSGEKYLTLAYYSDYFGIRYLQLVPQRVAFQSVETFTYWYTIFGVLVILIFILYAVYAYFAIKKPMNVLIYAFQKLESEDFSATIHHRAYDEFAAVYQSFNNMSAKLQSYIKDIYLQKNLTQKAELRQLQAQINPHFFYNSFFILRSRIDAGNYKNASDLCDMLGQFFQYMTKNYKDYSTMKEEVEYARIYSKIQANRFASRLEIEFDNLSSRFDDFVVPKLILQPILENAFRHGLEQKEFDGLLRVTFHDENEYLYVYVEDNGDLIEWTDEKTNLLNEQINAGFDASEIGGLTNIHLRVKIFLSEDSELTFEQSELGGLKVILKLKFQ